MMRHILTLILLFTADEVMAVIEKLIFRAVDQIQEFIMRRLLGELQEVKNNNSHGICSLELMHSCVYFETAVRCRASRDVPECPSAAGGRVPFCTSVPQ